MHPDAAARVAPEPVNGSGGRLIRSILSSTPGPLGAQGAVFFVIFALLAFIGWLQARTPDNAIPAMAAGHAAPAGRPDAAPDGAFAVLARIVPYITVVMAAFVPLAAGLYVLTTTAWTLAERTVLRRRITPVPAGRR